MKKRDKVSTRHDAIKELIKTTPIEDQQTLVSMIKQRYGIDTNQSIVSRDLRALGIGKHKVGEKMVYELPEHDASREILRLAIADISHNENVIAIQTLPGLASFVGDYLDLQEHKHILATIAGENVVMVFPTASSQTKELYNALSTLLYFKKTED
ncbi:MAG: hypothetical protein ACOYT8_06680 [Candidatus Dependentiae bacterium]